MDGWEEVSRHLCRSAFCHVRIRPQGAILQAWSSPHLTLHLLALSHQNCVKSFYIVFKLSEPGLENLECGAQGEQWDELLRVKSILERSAMCR